MSAALARGFADPATDGARAFRFALDAMARPGRVRRFSPPEAPDGLSPAAATLVLALADADTPLWLSDAAARAAPWALFHTGAPQTADPTRAAFGIGPWAALAPLDRWPVGEADYPDRSATLIVEVEAMDAGPALTLEGPGVDGMLTVAPRLPGDAAEALVANAARFPLGVDLFLTAGDALMALPRSTRVSREGACT